MAKTGARGILALVNDYFLLFLAGAMSAAGVVGGFLRHSVWAAFGWAAGVAGAVIVLFILVGPVSALLDAMGGLRADAAQRGWARALISAWAWGVVSWNPPHALLPQFLLIWAAILTAGALWVVPRFAAWPLGGKAAAVAACVFLAGAVNGAFRGAAPYGKGRGTAEPSS